MEGSVGANGTCSSDAPSAVRLSDLLAFVPPTRQGALGPHSPGMQHRLPHAGEAAGESDSIPGDL